MMSADTTVFLCGADMNPLTIRTRSGYATARFTGIGSIAAADLPTFPTALDRIWGIVLEGVEQLEGVPVQIERRDGSAIRGRIVTGPTDWAELQSVVSEARFWELPVAWWMSLNET